jgi:hypothetical protein
MILATNNINLKFGTARGTIVMRELSDEFGMTSCFHEKMLAVPAHKPIKPFYTKHFVVLIDEIMGEHDE